MSNQTKGALGEKLAADYLIRKGYQIIQRNFKARYEEIDIVARTKQLLIFVEVKTRSRMAFGTPEEAVTQRKMRSLVKAAQYFSLLHPELPEALQIDVITVQLDQEDRLVTMEHLPNVTA